VAASFRSRFSAQHRRPHRELPPSPTCRARGHTAQASRIEAADAFAIADPIARFEAVNAPHAKRLQAAPLALSLRHEADERGVRDESNRARRAAGAGVLDMHYQSVRTAPVVLEATLNAALQAHAEVWLITGTGHHTHRASHQRAAVGGVLHATVRTYLEEYGYDFFVGKDKAGHSGAFLVKG